MQKLVTLTVLASVMLLTSRLHAQQLSHISALASGGSACEASDCDAADDCTASSCCSSDQSGVFFDAEVTFFKFHNNAGIHPSNEFGFETSPRITVGYRSPDGLGTRLRWWKYDHQNHSARSPYAINTYNVDLEVFEEISLGSCTSIELSAGIRYNEFDQFSDDDDAGIGPGFGWYAFDGLGAIVGIEARRSVSCNSAIYARLRQAVLMDDYDVSSELLEGEYTLHDTVVGMTEIALGYETSLASSGCYSVNGRVGVEWQQWHNDLAGTWDSGFAGVTAGVSVDY